MEQVLDYVRIEALGTTPQANVVNMLHPPGQRE